MKNPPYYICCFFLLFYAHEAACQKGYVKISEDSIIEGYVRYRTPLKNGEREIELWRSKKDKHPLRFLESDLLEYSLGNEIIKVDKNVRPGPDTFVNTPKTYFINLGFGAGLDYGGLGARISFLPTDNVSFFGAVGYNLFQPAWNAGIIVKASPTKTVIPVFIAMYGYNTVLLLDDSGGYSDMHSKTYYGPSLGFGIEIKPREKNYFSIEALLPFRSNEYEEDMKNIRDNNNMELRSEPWPVLVSIGFHFALSGN